MTDDVRDLPQLLTESGPWTTAYLDGARDVPQVEEQARVRAVRDRLEDAGAPEADAVAVESALQQKQGLPSPSTRYLLVRDGEVEYEESFAGARLGPECAAHGPVPVITPLLRHRAATVRYLVVETGREGAEIRLERAGRRDPEQTEEVEGRTDRLPKVQAGGWAHARYQRHSEEIWKQTQSEVADAVERTIRTRRPAFVVLAGDVRARQLLRDGLGDRARESIVEVDAHTRAAGADSEQLDEAIAEAVATHLHGAIVDARDRAEADGGTGGAKGTANVVTALQQARVEALLLHERMLDADDALLALDAAPWVAVDGGGALDANGLGRIPAAEALARAALLTGARVLIEEEEEPAEGEARPDRPAPEPIAVLRWSRDEAEGRS